MRGKQRGKRRGSKGGRAREEGREKREGMGRWRRREEEGGEEGEEAPVEEKGVLRERGERSTAERGVRSAAQERREECCARIRKEGCEKKIMWREGGSHGKGVLSRLKPPTGTNGSPFCPGCQPGQKGATGIKGGLPTGTKGRGVGARFVSRYNRD